MLVSLLLLSLSQAQLAEAVTLGTPSGLEPVSQTFQAGELDANSQAWYNIDTVRDAKGNLVSITNLAYVELQTGMHYREGGQWKDSREVIESFPGGAIARQGGHKVIFAADFGSDVVVDLEMTDGQRLQSRVLGLAYLDSASGKSVWLAAATNAIGEIVEPNQVLYANAFNGLQASVRLTYTKAGLESDVILTERPPSPESFGLVSKSTSLQVMTEFLPPATPVVTSIKSGEPEGGEEDQLLDFGAMQMIRGRAFVIGLPKAISDQVPVQKQWSVIDGRTILIEQVPVTRIAEQLKALPAGKGTAFFRTRQAPAGWQAAAGPLKLPARTAAKAASRPMRMAQGPVPVTGLVLDYVLVSSAANFTFKGDSTYYVSATVVLSGTTSIQGGTVVKYLNNATTGISFTGPLVFQTGPYHPAVFTSKDDNSVGETISGSNNNPVKSTGNIYLNNGGAQANTSYRYLRFNYGGIGIQDGFLLDVWHCQFLNCTTGVNRQAGSVALRNVLFAGCTTCVGANTVDGQHLTVDACIRFASTTVTSGTIINSIFTAVTTLGNVTLPVSSVNLGSSSGVYKSTGAGNYYLAGGSVHRDIPATDTINATLAKDLQTRTTYAPDDAPNTLAVLSPTAPRDADVLTAPDRGYHYDPLDYCLTARTLGNGILLLTGGVAVGVYGSTGIILQSGGNLVSQGSPTALNRLVRYNTVQEQKYVWGANSDPTSLLSVTSTPLTPSPNLPTATMRFTEMSFLANSPSKRCLLATGGTNLVKTLSLQDCQVHNAYLYHQVYNNNPNSMTVTLLNNLLDRTDFTFNQGWQGDTTPFMVALRNNLVLKGTLNLFTSTTASRTWQVHDNFFDTVALTGSGSSKLVHTHNGYRATTQISGTTSANVSITTADYQTGPLGNYYYSTTVNGQNLARLIDTGSSAANLLGLCPYTVRTDQTPEGTSQVDIGFHYVALDANGVPLDNTVCPPPGCAIRSGFNSVSLVPNDDNHTGDGNQGPSIENLLADLPFAVKFYGSTFSNLFVNNNGNVTFGSSLDVFTPVPLVSVGQDIIAPFWADVDTRDSGSSVVSYGNGTVGGRSAFGVNWVNVGYFLVHSDNLISVQLVLIERFDSGAGNFDMEFNYCKVRWEAGDVSGGSGGFWTGPVGSPARAGFASASGSTFEFNGSGIPGAFLDSTPSTGLIFNDFNTTELGRYIFQFRGGTPQATP